MLCIPLDAVFARDTLSQAADEWPLGHSHHLPETQPLKVFLALSGGFRSSNGYRTPTRQTDEGLKNGSRFWNLHFRIICDKAKTYTTATV